MARQVANYQQRNLQPRMGIRSQFPHNQPHNQDQSNKQTKNQMMNPSTPYQNRQLLWHTYSAQAYGIYHGDLDFYFNGWDGRGRVEKINTKKCPIYFLTGEYDWSNTPEMTEETVKKIPGAMFKRMPGLGHFPATENPWFCGSFLLEAIDFIEKVHGD